VAYFFWATLYIYRPTYAIWGLHAEADSQRLQILLNIIKAPNYHNINHNLDLYPTVNPFSIRTLNCTDRVPIQSRGPFSLKMWHPRWTLCTRYRSCGTNDKSTSALLLRILHNLNHVISASLKVANLEHSIINRRHDRKTNHYNEIVLTEFR